MKIDVTADIPFGNVTDVHTGEYEGIPEIAFAAHPHGGTESLWFCFQVSIDGTPPEKLLLTLRHPDTMLGIGRGTHCRPVVRREGGDWERLEGGSACDLPDGRWTVRWEVHQPSNRFQVAFCYPYGPDEFDALLCETNGAFRADTIGVSQHGRPIQRLSNSSGDPDNPGLYITARQHSGEVPGSWVLDSMIREFADAGDRAPLVWAVPFTNIDGVIEGDYGKDPFPQDLNRAWSEPAMRHEVLVMQRDIHRWQTRCIPTLGLDLHGPGANESTGVYAFLANPALYTASHQKAMRWVSTFQRALGEYAWEEFGRVAHYSSRWSNNDSFAAYFRKRGIAVNSVETPYGMINDIVLTRERYREIGSRMAGAIMDELERQR